MAAHSEEHGIAGSRTLFVRNLPCSSTNETLENVFSDIGPIKECFVVNEKGTGKCRGFGYVKFSLFEDAERALKTVKKVDGRPVHLMFANKKEKKKRQQRPPPNAQTPIDDNEDIKPDVTEVKDEPGVHTDSRTVFTRKPKPEKAKIDPKSRVEGKRARLIVRNLSFWCSEDQLREAFSKYGTIVDVHIPTKEGGKKLGFGFVQFSNKAEAGMAVKYQSGKPINDRPVAVDFTLPKVMYEQKISAQASSQAKEDSKDSGEAMDDDDEMETSIKDEIKEEDISEDNEEEEDEDSEGGDEENDSGSESDKSDDDSEAGDSESDEDTESESGDYSSKPKKRIERPPDVNQGKTIFIRNLPFDVDQDDIKDYFSQFGSVIYARCVMDRDTGMSKGSAFVKFSTKDGADSCLKGSAGGGQHSIGGRDLFVTLALDKDTAQGLKKDKKKLPKDSRNLYLAREGMIRPGTLAAKDLPASDLAKRLKNDEMKRKKLKDQNTFISSTRLCVHNIPATVTAKALRAVILKHSECKTSELKEAKIMWDTKRVNSEGKPKSKGYGFIGFSTHETALVALRKLNNNADIFGASKRPIVEFAIENRKALQLKEKRFEKFKMRAHEEKEKQAMQGKLKKKGLKRKATGASLERANQDKIARSLHSGPIGLPRHSGPKQRHKPRPGQMHEKTKKPKRLMHQAAVNPERKQREPKVKPKENSRRKKGRMDTDDFDKIVAAHKKRMMSSSLSL